jgi:hypothetical protein
MPKRVRSGEIYLLAPGETLPGKELYRVDGFLGQGSFAAAYRAVDPRGEYCFVKEYFPARRPSAAAELARVYATERDVVRRIGNYELIPRFRDAFQYEGYSYLVTDFIPGPDLETVLRSRQKPNVEALARWCVCLAHELAYLHRLNVVHHDLKPGNIRLNEDGDPVIVDFSAAHWYRTAGETTDQLYGSNSYLAPEYSERSTESVEDGKLMDVFALGRIYVEMIVGQRLTQDEIDRRRESLYGELLHGGRLDTAFVRAVLRAVSYDPARRYASGVELAEELTPAAPPVGRVRPARIDFGSVSDGARREVVLQAYNVGGGTLRAEIAAEGDWFEVGTTTAVTGRAASFERNRQAVRVVAFPERVPPGSTSRGHVLLNFPSGVVHVPVSLTRSHMASEVRCEPAAVRIQAGHGATGGARVTFANVGSAAASVRLQPAPGLHLRVNPVEFTLAPGGRQEVQLEVDAASLGEIEVRSELRWFVEGNARPPIPVTASVRRGGVLDGLAGRLRRK